MPRRYQEIYPESPLVDSAGLARPGAASLLTLEYFEAEPSTMPTAVFEQHHVLLNLKPEDHRVEHWRAGEHRDFTYRLHEVIATPAGTSSGWRWHARSKVIVVTLEPEALERFARTEMGVLLTSRQLADRERFVDEDLCRTGVLLLDALRERTLGSDVIFESLARVFLVKLVRDYTDRPDEAAAAGEGLTGTRYRAVLDLVATGYGGPLGVEDLANAAHLAPSSFARQFKAAVGVTPMQFVTAYRVERARERLADPEAPMAGIAADCGFADQAHFSRTFKRVAGETPRAYRGRVAP